MASSKIILYASKILKNGKHPLMLRAIKDRKIKYFSLGFSCKPDQWDELTCTLKKGYPNYKKINLLLNKKKNELEEIIINFQNDDKDFSTQEIALKFRGSLEKKTIFKYLQEVIDRLTNTNKLGNASVYKNLLRTITHFQKGKDLMFSDISYAWLMKFEEEFLSRGVQETTISLDMRTLRALFNRAVKEGYCKETDYPFKTFKISNILSPLSAILFKS